jgi:Complex I intermediate-associated protein 30 (CIA30)
VQKGEWTTIEVPFSSFRPVFRARTRPDAPPLDPSKVTSLQLMLSKFEYDGELNPAFAAGRFELPIADVRAYMAAQPAPRFVHVSSAGVTRCVLSLLAAFVCSASCVASLNAAPHAASFHVHARTAAVVPPPSMTAASQHQMGT